MADIKTAFATVVSLTVTNLHSLAASITTGAWQSAVQDNSTNKYLDALVQVVLVSSGTVASYKQAIIYAYASVDGGTTYSEGASGSEAAFTFTSNPPNLVVVGTVNMDVNSGTFKSALFSVAAAFGGILPEKWGLAIQNQSNVALASSGNLVKIHPIYATAT